MHPIRHFRTITRHRHQVIRNCFRAGIGAGGLKHDLSKYSPAEFWVGAKYYYGDHSPNDGERAARGYSLAWMHHKGRNKHHFEYWSDYNPQTRTVEPVKMPVRYVKEMFCDRVAASKIYQGRQYTDRHPLDYFLRGNARQKMHPATADLLEAWLRMLAEQGETATFRHIRNVKDY